MKNPYPWTTGPTAPYLDNKRFRVHYRTRPGEWAEWATGAIEMVMKDEGAAKKRAIQTVTQYHRELQMEVTRVVEVSAEAPIQTGREVKTVSESERSSQIEEAKEQTEDERKEMLRLRGLIIP